MVSTPTEASRQRRNRNRQDHADEADLYTIGESTKEGTGKGKRRIEERGLEKTGQRRVHLNNKASTFFGAPIRGPSDSFVTPDWFLTALQDVASEDPSPPEPPPIHFENTTEAAELNAELLETVGFDIERLVRKFAKSTLGYGSEFRTVAQLEPLIGRHPHFRNLSRVLEFGMDHVFSRELDTVTSPKNCKKFSRVEITNQRRNFRTRYRP